MSSNSFNYNLYHTKAKTIAAFSNLGIKQIIKTVKRLKSRLWLNLICELPFGSDPIIFDTNHEFEFF